jgi:alpha-L-rhamnosidase
MNHCMFGHAQEWFQKSIVGIRQAPGSIGFSRLLLRPEPVGDLTSAAGHYDSVRGRIESKWRIENGRFLWSIVVPPNVTAEVHVPTTAAEVTESGRPADQAESVTFVRVERGHGAEGGYAVLNVGSGEYEFQSPYHQD